MINGIKKIYKLLRLIFTFPYICLVTFITFLPGDIGVLLRQIYWKRRLKYLGNKVMIDTGVYIQNPEYVTIDENTWIDRDVIIMAGKDKSKREKITLTNNQYKGFPCEVYIGKNVHIGKGMIISGISAGVWISDNCTFSAYSMIYSFTHHYRSFKNPSDSSICFGSMCDKNKQCLLEGPVYFAPNVGVALNSVILPGVSIHEKSFVCINSVVYHGNYFENSLLAGNPAKLVGKRFEDISIRKNIQPNQK